jgi:hypothetical protein
MALGFMFEPSLSHMYWSTQLTMQRYIKFILAPYYERKIAELGLPEDQQKMLQLDCWSVHKSVEFISWMTDHHPTISLNFVLGGCTGEFQPFSHI